MLLFYCCEAMLYAISGIVKVFTSMSQDGFYDWGMGECYKLPCRLIAMLSHLIWRAWVTLSTNVSIIPGRSRFVGTCPPTRWLRDTSCRLVIVTEAVPAIYLEILEASEQKSGLTNSIIRDCKPDSWTSCARRRWISSRVPGRMKCLSLNYLGVM